LAAGQRHRLAVHHHLELRHHAQQALFLFHFQVPLSLVMLHLLGIRSITSRCGGCGSAARKKKTRRELLERSARLWQAEEQPDSAPQEHREAAAQHSRLLPEG
jgi:hypothetical protein